MMSFKPTKKNKLDHGASDEHLSRPTTIAPTIAATSQAKEEKREIHNATPSHKRPLPIDIEALTQPYNHRVKWSNLNDEKRSCLTLVSESQTKTKEKGVFSRSSRVIAFNLDDTLITQRMLTDGVDRYDWQWLYACIPDRLRLLHNEGHRIIVFTEVVHKDKQEGIKQKILDMQQLLGFPFEAFLLLPSCDLKKPSGDMWDMFPDMDGKTSVYVGNDAGRPAGWDGNPLTMADNSDVDKQFAANGLLPFMTPDEFFHNEPRCLSAQEIAAANERKPFLDHFPNHVGMFIIQSDKQGGACYISPITPITMSTTITMTTVTATPAATASPIATATGMCTIASSDTSDGNSSSSSSSSSSNSSSSEHPNHTNHVTSGYQYELPSLPQPLYNLRYGFYTAACVNGSIYIAGGAIDFKHTAATQVFDIPTHQWSAGPRMNVPRVGHLMVPFIGSSDAAGDRLMVIGGPDRGESCEILDIKSESWLTAPPLILPTGNSARSSQLCCASYHGRIYVFGGMFQQSGEYRVLSVCMMYEDQWSTGVPRLPRLWAVDLKDGPRIGHGEWFTRTAMAHARDSAAAVVVDDTILVMGGSLTVSDIELRYGQKRQPIDIIEEYTPATDKWRTLSWTLPKPFARVAAVYHQHTRTLMVIGMSNLKGFRSEKEVTQNEVYTITQPFASNQWVHHTMTNANLAYDIRWYCAPQY